MFLAFFLVGNQSKFAALGMCFAQVVSVPLLFWNGINRARVAERAAFLLAEVGDERAITCLANLWTPHPRGKQDAAVNARAGAELMRWIAAQNGNRFDMTTEDALRRVITRSFPQGRWARTRQRLRPPPDLTEADLDLLLSIVRYLSRLPPAKASASPTADVAALWQVASSSRAGTHYDLLRDTTQVLILQHAQKETPCRKTS